MHVLYDIEEKDRTFIPGTRHLRMRPAETSWFSSRPEPRPHGGRSTTTSDRMVVAVNYNTDVGDAWEFADAPEYPERMTALAYRYGINYIIYAMTH